MVIDERAIAFDAPVIPQIIRNDGRSICTFLQKLVDGAAERTLHFPQLQYLFEQRIDSYHISRVNAV